MNKNIFLILIASISMASAAFASIGDRTLPQAQVPSVVDPKEEPYVLKQGLDTQLIKGQPSLREYINARRAAYEQRLDDTPSSQLDSVDVFFISFEGALTLHRSAYMKNFSQYGPAANHLKKMMAEGNAVVCPYGESLAIIVGTQNTVVCGILSEFYKQQEAYVPVIR